MHPADAYTIRYATRNDVPALRRLVQLAGARLFCGPALIAEIGGAAAAAVSLADGRIIADPSQSTTVARQLLATRRDALRATRTGATAATGRRAGSTATRPTPRV